MYYGIYCGKRKRRSHLVRVKVLFHQCYVPVHTTVIVVAKINGLPFELLLYAPYSPNLSHADYFLICQIFVNTEELESAFDDYFEELNGSHYKQGNEGIEHRWEKYIELEGDCGDNSKYFFSFSLLSRILLGLPW